MEKTKVNHLADETSPYLIQHQDNPVDWYPWGDEALSKAKRENKPILLSIGYSSCHWCHVMAHESFEDPETAELMNHLYVNIKVDREERPELDKIYQTTHALLTQRGGGWPLTVFLTPDDLTPYFSGTYFPKEARLNLPAFKYVLRTLSDLYRNHGAEIKAQNQELKQVLSYVHEPNKTEIKLSLAPIEEAKKVLRMSYDDKNGGFGVAPKFPQAPMLEFLIQQTSDPTADKLIEYKEGQIVVNTLHHMADGGIYDQLGSGFFRYSVDAEWKIPHFEKMLYDNAELLYLYAEAARQFDEPHFAKIAHDLAEWVIKKMQAPKGAFYGSINADSEDQEGKYYIWNKYEVRKILNDQEYQLVNSYYGLDQVANFEKLWHLYVAKPLKTVASDLNLSLDQARKILNSAKKKLLSIREKRTEPSQDTKILTAWNALLIKGLLTAYETLDEPRYKDAAEKTLEYIRKNMMNDNRLYSSYKDGKTQNGYLDDYAFLLSALIMQLQIKWSDSYLQWATVLADDLLELFMDKTNGGFYFTAIDHEPLLQRPKPITDEAMPSGNGIAARALITLGHLLGETKYLEAAEKTLIASWDMLTRYPAEHCSLLMALFDFLEPPFTVVIRGPEAELKSWQQYAHEFIHLQTFTVPNSSEKFPGLLGAPTEQNKVSASICQGLQCLSIVNDFNEFKNALEKIEME